MCRFDPSGLCGKKVYVGFSGGADSTALLLLLSECAEKLKLTLHAIHFDHQLRNDSADDACWCEEFCKNKNIPFSKFKLDVTGTMNGAEGVEAAARRLRLNKWRELVEPSALAALGHHRDDRVENLMLRLCRGSNVSGLTSMRREAQINGVNFIRPLLDWSKDEIVSYLHSVGIDSWREDSSNNDNDFRRNFFRNRIMPEIYAALKFAEKGVPHSIDALEQDALLLEELAQKTFKSVSNLPGMPLGFLQKQHPALKIRVLRLWLAEQRGADIIPDRRLMERLSALPPDVSSGETRYIPLKGTTRLKLRNGVLRIDHDIPVPEAVDWHWQTQEQLSFGNYTIRAEVLEKTTDMPEPGRFRACFDADNIPEVLTLRSWWEGDRMGVSGRCNQVKLKKLFSDAGVPAEEKQSYPVFTLPNGEIIWLGGVRRSDFGLVSEETIRVLCLSIGV
ncbi:MAG: tRNA lysidine(34) synthetase TilS [Victivallales bacterium]|nr:tRNA lysidine(34) synthetase TilS [Victivallales bacterium]